MIRKLVEELYINKSTEVDLTLILTPQHPGNKDDDAHYMGLYYLMCLTAMRTPSVQHKLQITEFSQLWLFAIQADRQLPNYVYNFVSSVLVDQEYANSGIKILYGNFGDGQIERYVEANVT